MADSRNLVSKRAKCRYYCRVFFTHLFSHIGLCALVIGYAIVGAFTFRYLEYHPPPEHLPVEVQHEKYLEELWNITETLNVLYKDEWTLLVRRRLIEFEREVVTAVKNEKSDENDGLEWSFSSALLYSITVITTIGYGNIAPKTDVGKVVTMLYALFGIPLMLLCLTNIGDFFARTFKFTYSHFCLLCSNRRRQRTTSFPSQKQPHAEENNKTVFEKVIPDAVSMGLYLNDEKKSVISDGSSPTSSPPSNKCVVDNNSSVIIHESNPVIIERVYSARSRSLPQAAIVDDDSERVPMYMVLILVSSYICGGAALFSLWENWTFLDGAYFCFITLSTIGFGDLVPGSDILDIDSGQAKLIICCFYLILGLAIIAMSFNLVQEEVVIKAKNLARNLGCLGPDNDDEDD